MREASVVIPSWNGAALLRPTLERLALLEGVAFEVLVVDHGRLNRDTEALLHALADPRFVYLGVDEQLGYAGAVNYGAARAKHALVAVLCNDVLVETDWLLELVRAFGERRALGRSPVVSSLVSRPGFDEPLRHRLNLWGRVVRTKEEPGALPLFFPDGSAFLFDRGALGPPFDADYFLYQEDVSLGWRAWLSGEEVVLASRALALNADGGTTRRTPYRTAFFTERNRWLNCVSYLGASALLRALPALLVDALLRLGAGSNRLAKLHAWAWLLAHPGTLARKRREKQRLRRRSDREILPLLSGRYLDRDGALNAAFRAYFRVVGLPLG
jgi:GT2 family glycosyltransferase